MGVFHLEIKTELQTLISFLVLGSFYWFSSATFFCDILETARGDRKKNRKRSTGLTLSITFERGLFTKVYSGRTLRCKILSLIVGGCRLRRSTISDYP